MPNLDSLAQAWIEAGFPPDTLEIMTFEFHEHNARSWITQLPMALKFVCPPLLMTDPVDGLGAAENDLGEPDEEF